MRFDFDIHPVSRTDLAEQLARGLDLRSELRSRKPVKPKQETPETEDAAKRRNRRNKIYGIFFLVIGLALAIPGFFASKETNWPTIGGVMAAVVGLSYLLPKSNKPSARNLEVAKKLMAARTSSPMERLCFTEDGMIINDSKLVLYTDMEGILETADLYLLIINNGAMFFTKEELADGDSEAFSAFLQSQSNLRFLPIGD